MGQLQNHAIYFPAFYNGNLLFRNNLSIWFSIYSLLRLEIKNAFAVVIPAMNEKKDKTVKKDRAMSNCLQSYRLAELSSRMGDYKDK